MITIKNYRAQYKKYLGIDFDSSIHVHHIDGDRQNNAIENLVALPKKLHASYHMQLNLLAYCVDRLKQVDWELKQRDNYLNFGYLGYSRKERKKELKAQELKIKNILKEIMTFKKMQDTKKLLQK